MYSIKIMSSENMADSDVGKGFKMILVDAGDTFEFGHDPQGKPIVTVSVNKGDDSSHVEYPLTGNAYVMSETGKTVASFWGRKKVTVTIDPKDPDPTRTIEAIQKEIRDVQFSNGLGVDIDKFAVGVADGLTENHKGLSNVIRDYAATAISGKPSAPLEIIVVLEENTEAGTAHSSNTITDHTPVTKYNKEQRDKIYRSRVAQRMRLGETQEQAMLAEARWINDQQVVIGNQFNYDKRNSNELNSPR